MIGMSALYRQKDGVVTRDVLGETLLVPIRGAVADMDKIFRLNSLGALIWRRLDGLTSAESIHREIIDAYDVESEEAMKDIRDLLLSLLDADLIEAVSCE
jgi:hypothetical protein